jgi:hypothetical protein
LFDEDLIATDYSGAITLDLGYLLLSCRENTLGDPVLTSGAFRMEIIFRGGQRREGELSKLKQKQELD